MLPRKALRRGRVKAVNRRRKKAAHARNFGDEADAVRRMPCLACGRFAEACHVTARGMGGAKGGRFDIVPLCREHHQEAGEAGTSQRETFEREHGLDLRKEADHIAVRHGPDLGLRGAYRRMGQSRRVLGGLALMAESMALFADGDFAGAAACQVFGAAEMSQALPQMASAYDREAVYAWARRMRERFDDDAPGVMASVLSVTREECRELLAMAMGERGDA